MLAVLVLAGMPSVEALRTRTISVIEEPRVVLRWTRARVGVPLIWMSCVYCWSSGKTRTKSRAKTSSWVIGSGGQIVRVSVVRMEGVNDPSSI